MVEFYIALDNTSLVFQPGVNMTGTAVLKLDEPCSARYVKIYVDGRAETAWKVSHTHTVRNADGTHRSQTHTVRHSATVIYAQGEAVVWGNGNKEKLQPGEHTFPFSFHLPTNCAPSFEGKYGHIRYHCKAKVDRPWKFDHETKQPFTVIPQFNLNSVPQLFSPVTSTVCENTGVPLFRRGKIELKVTLPKGGFVPGENIPILVTVNNMSKKDVESVEIKLQEKVVYYASANGREWFPNDIFPSQRHKDDHREEKRMAAEISQELIVPSENEGSETILLRIPPVVSTFNNCPNIQVKYDLKVEISSQATFNSTVDTKLPIVIGTIPISINPQSYSQGYPTYPENNGSPSYTENQTTGGGIVYPSYPFNDSGNGYPMPPLPQTANIYPQLPYPSAPVADSPDEGNQTMPSAPPLVQSPGGSAMPPYSPILGPPPSYADSVFGAGIGVSEEKEKDPGFTPRYPFYDLPADVPAAETKKE